jgi:hypothetical protein
MTADLAAYAAAGAHTVQALMTGTGPWRAPHPNPWLFSRLTWNPQQDTEALLDDWRAALAPDSKAVSESEPEYGPLLPSAHRACRLATEPGLDTVGDAFDHLEAMPPSERRRLLDEARVEAGLPSTDDVDAQQRFERAVALARAKGARESPWRFCASRRAAGSRSVSWAS